MRNANTIRLLATTLLLTTSALALPGCGGGVNKSNYDKVQNDMTQAQVEDILGKGEQSNGAALGGLSMQVMTWTSGDKKITVSFMNGKVASKAENGL